MKMRVFIPLFACLAITLAKSIVEDCGPKDAYIRFNKIDIEPMPFNILGKIKVTADVETLKEVGNAAKLSVNIRKSNLNGGFTWEVPCTNIGAIGGKGTSFDGYLGTCDYKGSCDFPLIKSWTTKQTCPAFFKDYKIPCKCPFPPQKLSTKGQVEFDLAQFEDRLPKWLIEGGYTVEAKMMDTTNNDKLVACLKMKFDVNARKPCPAILKKFNACGDNQY